LHQSCDSPSVANRRRAKLPLVSPLAILGLLLTALAWPGLAQPSHAIPGAWQRIGMPGGSVISLAVASDRTVYLGAADGHIFASQDAGRHWSLRGRVSVRHDAVIQKLLVDARDKNQLFAAVWFQDVREGGGVFRSRDAGASWTLAALPGEIVRTIEQSAGAPQVFVAGARNGVFRSTDAAQTWERISPSGDPELRNIDSVALDPRDPETIYVGTYHLPWKTSDAGRHWSAISSGMIDDSDVMSLRLDFASPARIFASACSGIYRSENAGALWTKLQGIPYSSRRTQTIVQDPRDAQVLYAATTEGLWLTRDGGESWARTTPREWVVNDLVILPAPAGITEISPSRLLLGTEAQGVLFSDDGGITFTPVNDGFFHRVTAALLSDPRDAQHLLAWMPGSPDPLITSVDGGEHWQALTAPSPPQLARIFATGSGWWAASANGVLSAYDAAAGRWAPVRFASAAPGVTSRATGGRAGLRRAPPARRGPLTGFDILDVRTLGARVFVATPQALWSGTLGEKILRPITESISAQESGAPQQEPPVWMLAGGKILQSRDGGKTWHAENPSIASAETDAVVRWIQELPIPDAPAAIAASSTLLLAGTTQGIYRRGENGAWQLVQNGLPAAEPLAYFLGPRAWVVALRGAGLYLSRDASQTWERLDVAPSAGPFTGAAVTPSGDIVAASLTEGLLRYRFRPQVPAIAP
jgi:photosystem II stability/assembly factor-like uncharacterized protein